MAIPGRLERQEGRFALVDGIPFALPVNCARSPALFAVFPIDAERAKALLPGNEIHPLRLWKKGLLVVSVIDYRVTDIGKYIEFSIAIACTRGSRPAPPLLPALLWKPWGTGQFVFDLPVSTEISVKGGKGIWGMPKHQANLDYVIDDKTVSSQYDLDGQLCMRIEIDRPASATLPFSAAAANYAEFRGMLMKSFVHFRGKVGVSVLRKGSARLTLGNHPRLAALKQLRIEPDPLFTAFVPEANGILDDHCESWFVSFREPPASAPEGLESVVRLGLGEQRLPPPGIPSPKSPNPRSPP
ncbi:MAG: acetoacetate decarboxylase family protein [Acidobacteria bacterium]|nr:acetoacetate decarboxylase family protein [Acidobacteriota bacterium]MCA1611681.1 acetoacetate decarboxylase family protein [Acidobacteriota bacterium]